MQNCRELRCGDRTGEAMRKTIATALALGVLTGAATAAQQTRPAGPGGAPGDAAPAAGVDRPRLQKVDGLIAAAIAAKETPGAVLLVSHRGQIVYRKAYGNRAVSPSVEPMTLDTIFDLASVTKPVATATSIMILVEEGRIRLSDRVAAYIPEFAAHGKDAITIRHLLTHVSGLRPDLDLANPWTGYDTAIALAADEVPLTPPGERFVYSDINFFLLGDIVRRVSGMPLDEFARARIFEPLGMKETRFNPPEALHARVAPTERCTPYGWPCEGPDMRMLRGVVHDPTARRMGGVAGHAGLFSTAADLAILCRMLLGGGALGGARILSPLAVAKMTSPASAPGERNVRGLGWDIDSSYSANRGELFPIGSFGHTGFTGTSLWIDPATETFVVFLSNRLHPDGKGDVTPLRARIATAVAAAITDASAAARRPAVMTGGDFGASGPAPARSRERVLTGIDVLKAEGFARLAGRRVGLVTNHTGRARDGISTIDLFFGAKNLTLAALFSPEHGIRGVLDENVPAEKDEKTGLTVLSLYGQTRRPTAQMLDGIDTLVVDLQEIGARFYTYIATMAYAMEEAAKRGIKVVVLDRPNPIGGVLIEGPMPDPDRLSFVAYYPMPIRHSLTMGELARLFNAENKIGADLTVVEMRGWRRDAWFDETGLPWVNPSPNMRNMIAAEVYPGIGAIEGTNISVGRGTDTPFEQIGAPWIDGMKLADELNGRRLAGVRFYPVAFTPASSKYANEPCQGVFILVTDRDALRPVRVGLEIASALVRLHGDQYTLADATSLFGSRADLARVLAGEEPVQVAAGWASSEAKWRLLRSKYVIYR
jgi:uncharacterized protein YbbC (DUF1343 family)/CubicO group peptidase (beta-lactamase class C family)